MFDRIMVPLDGSETAERALPYAAMLARAWGSEVVLVTVVSPVEFVTPTPDTSAYLTPGVVEETLAAARASSLAYLEHIRRRLGEEGITARSVVREGVPVEELVEAEAVERPGLVVMATHGRTGLARLVLGSVAERVVETGTAPVLLVPTRVTPRPFRQVLVALDGSPESERAVAPAVTLANAFGGEVILAQVVPEDAPDPGAAEATARRYLDAIAEQALAGGVSVSVSVLVGPIADALVAEVESRDVDLIALTLSGEPGRWRLGSLARALLGRAVAPLLLVRASRGRSADSSRPTS